MFLYLGASMSLFETLELLSKGRGTLNRVSGVCCNSRKFSRRYSMDNGLRLRSAESHILSSVSKLARR
jgi:hypothetical protein